MILRPVDYYHQRYGLSLPHSEVQALLPRLAGGEVLDLGCGKGRNTLFLRDQGYAVTAWDNNPQQLHQLNQIISQEQLTGITTQQCDLDQIRFNGHYQAVISTVTMMFLQPTTIPQLIADMQAATAKHGFNLIVSAMSTEDMPCPLAFPFTFSSGELSHYYRRWHIIHYNEHIGELHKRDAQGERIKMRFATLLAQKATIKNL